MNKKQKGTLDSAARLKSVLEQMSIQPEARYTSPKGRWLILFGKETLRHCSWVVLCIREDWVLDVRRFDTEVVSDADTYDTVRHEVYTQGREHYEKICERLKANASSGTTEEADEESGLEIINPDGSTEKYTIN